MNLFWLALWLYGCFVVFISAAIAKGHRPETAIAAIFWPIYVPAILLSTALPWRITR